MPDCTESPVPPPNIYSYTFTRGDQQWKADLYAPADLWRQSQGAGRWADPHDNVLTLATVRLPKPGGFSKEHVSREEYEQSVRKAGRFDPKWDQALLTQWVADFTEGRALTVEPLPKPPPRLSDLMRAIVDGDAGRRAAYLFRLNPKASGQYKAPPHWFMALFEINGAIPLREACDTIERSFLTTISSRGVSVEDPAGPSRQFQSTRVIRDKRKSPEFLASRDQVAASIQNMDNWWFAETRNYIILSNMGTRHRVMVKQLQENIEYLRVAFEALIPPLKDIRAVSVIRVFATPEEYVRYVGPEHEWTAGVWMGSKKELVIKPVDWGGNQQLREQVLRVTYHEAFHQYLHYALDQVHAAAWFNEGHASFLENADVSSRKFAVKEDEPKAALLGQMLERDQADLSRLLRMSYADFYANDEESRKRHYALAWGLVYYLRQGAPLERGAPHAEVPEAYVKALAQTQDPNTATETAFRGIRMEDFEKTFSAFWRSRNKRSAAARYRLLESFEPPRP